MEPVFIWLIISWASCVVAGYFIGSFVENRAAYKNYMAFNEAVQNEIKADLEYADRKAALIRIKQKQSFQPINNDGKSHQL